jgi:hypothetical protein
MPSENNIDWGVVTRPTHFGRLIDRSHRVLGVAIAASLLAHLVAVALPGPSTAEPEALPMLTATITEMPPPPALVAKPAARRHKPRPVSVAPVLAAEASEVAIPPAVSAPEPTPEAVSETPAPAEEASPTIAVAAPSAPPVAPTLPPRIELVYRGFLGTQGFFIGDAVYRLEHTDSQYTITTVAQARGVAALFLRGEGRLSSTGTITRGGLQPNLYTAERTSDGRHEAATFDWETGIVLLNDHKTAALEAPTFDPLAVLWQFYFAPPEQDEAEFNVATTRRVYHSRFRKVGVESVQLGFGEVETQVWERTGGDGNLTARIWLAPSLHHVAVKMRLSNGRITGEALLDSIRVDDTVAQR